MDTQEAILKTAQKLFARFGFNKVLFPIEDEHVDTLIEKIEQFNRDIEYEGI